MGMEENRSYRRAKVSHHKTRASAVLKWSKLCATRHPDVHYDLIVNQDTPYMPHEVWIIDYRRAS